MPKGPFNKKFVPIFIAGLISFGFASGAYAFIGPTAGQNPGSGGGLFNVDSNFNIGYGTASPSPTKIFDSTSTQSGSTGHGYTFLVASTTNPGVGVKNLTSGNMFLWSARDFGNFQLYRESAVYPGLVVFDVDPLGDVGIVTRATTTARLSVNGSVQATGALIGNLSGSLSAANVSSDVFGRLQSNGNFAFPASLGIATSSQNGLPNALSVYGAETLTQASGGNAGLIYLNLNGGANSPDFNLKVGSDGSHNGSAIGITAFGRGSGSEDLRFETANWSGSYTWGYVSQSGGTKVIGVLDVLGGGGTGTTDTGRFRLSSVTDAQGGYNGGSSNGITTIQLDAASTNPTYFNAGNVGVGTTTPSMKFVVAGGATGDSGLVRFNPAGAGNNRTVEIGSGGGYGYVNALQTANGGTANLALNVSGGSVGIGTSTPASKLQVWGDVRFGALGNNAVMDVLQNQTLIPPGGSNFGASYGSANSGHIFLDVKNNDINDAVVWRYSAANNGIVDTIGAVFRSDGDVGIATTTPGYPLTVAGTIYSSSGGFRFPDGTTQTTAFGGGTQVINASYVSAGVFGSNSSKGNYEFQNSASTTDVMFIDAVNNRVGIGTNAPTYPLDVTSSTRVQNNLYIGTGGGYISNDSGNRIKVSADFWANGTNVYLYGTTVYLGNSSGATIQMRGNALTWTGGSGGTINSSGNVGIGTTSPGYKLEIASTTAGSYSEVIGNRNYLGFRRGDGSLVGTVGIGPNDWMYIGMATTSAAGNTLDINYSYNLIFSHQGTQTAMFTGTNGDRFVIGTSDDSTNDFQVNGTSHFTGNVGIGTVSPYGPLSVAGIGWSDQTVAPDTTVMPTSTPAGGLVLDGSYTDGRYRTRFAKIDRGGNLPLYVEQSIGTANVFTNVARFGTFTNNTNNFEVFGNAAISGNFGIGTSTPANDLVINGSTGILNLGASNWIDPGSTGGSIVADNSTYKALMIVGNSIAGNSGKGREVKVWDYLNAQGQFNANGSSTLATTGGNVGIGTSNPTGAKLVIVPGAQPAINVGSQKIINLGYPSLSTDAASVQYVSDAITNAVGGVSTSTGAYVLKSGDTMSGNLNMGGNNISGVNKLYVTTIDPLYTIGGTTYATYGADTVGLKTEVDGKVKLSKQGSDYRYIVDFGNLDKGSDLWLFWQTIDGGKNMENIVATMTPEGAKAKVWYELKPESAELVFYGDAPVTVSYHLSAPRFDAGSYENVSNAGYKGTTLREK